MMLELFAYLHEIRTLLSDRSIEGLSEKIQGFAEYTNVLVPTLESDWYHWARFTSREIISLYARTPAYASSDESIRKQLGDLFESSSIFHCSTRVELQPDSFNSGPRLVDALRSENPSQVFHVLREALMDEQEGIVKDLLRYFESTLLPFHENITLSAKAWQPRAKQVVRCMRGEVGLLIGFAINFGEASIVSGFGLYGEGTVTSEGSREAWIQL